MNIAVVIAAGVGARTGLSIPKQFYCVDGKPIVIYTLEVFERHPSIDAIIVVCLDGWEKMLRDYCDKYSISKLRHTVCGGSTSQESIRNGVIALEAIADEDDLVVIHDGVRPMVDEAVLSNLIIVASERGNAVASMPYNEQIFVTQDGVSSQAYIPRETVRRVQTPQCYRYKKLREAYKQAFDEGVGVHPSSYANTLMVDIGEKLYFSQGSEKNLKITTEEDLELFSVFLRMRG